MKSWFLTWAGLALLMLLVLSETTAFLENVRTGLLIGVAVVVLLIYPAVLHNHEKRLAALEGTATDGGGSTT